MGLEEEFRGLKAAIGFLTTIPVKVSDKDYDSFIKRVYLFIITGIIAGIIIGFSSYLIQSIFPQALVAILIVAFIFLLTGINHIDGLSDTGDGIIAGGSRDKKIMAMKDVHTGAGGVLFILMDILLLLSAVSTFMGRMLLLAYALMVSEVCAKAAMVTVISFGKSLHEGMGSMVISSAKKSHYFIGIVIALVFCMIAMGYAGLIITPWPLGTNIMDTVVYSSKLSMMGFCAVLASVLTGFAVLYIANKNFGGVNGDVIGASNEAARIVSLIIMGTILWML